MLQRCHKFVVIGKQAPKSRTLREPYPTAVPGSEGQKNPRCSFQFEPKISPDSALASIRSSICLWASESLNESIVPEYLLQRCHRLMGAYSKVLFDLGPFGSFAGHSVNLSRIVAVSKSMGLSAARAK